MIQKLLHNVSRGMTLAMSGWLLAACSPADGSPLGPAASTPALAVLDLATADVGAKAAKGKKNATTAVETLASTSQVLTLSRLVPLASDLSASALIGPAGGVLTLPAAGVTLVVPKGAVDSTVMFSITALAGSVVAYEFEPHGMQFKKALALQQVLGLTGWKTTTKLGGGYFKSRGEIDQSAGTATIHEKLKATLKKGDLLLDLHHFSGYLVSMG